MSDTQIDKLTIEIETEAKDSATAFDKLTEALSKLQTSVDGATKSLNNIKQSLSGISSSVDRNTTSLDKNATSFDNTKTATKEAGTGMNEFTESTKTSTLAITSIVAKVQLMIAAFSKSISFFKNAITSSMDYIEDVNLFTTTMGEYAEEAYNFGQKASSVLGIDISDWMRNQGVFYTIIEGFGVASEKASTMSQNLTQLGYDIASFFNLSVEESMQKISSGIAGEMEPLRRIGYDLSVARLQLEATNLGIDKSVSSMTQAEKAALRYYTMMTQVTVVQGDMARTINAPANQLRVLKAQFTIAAREIGNIFIPIMNALLPILIAVARAIRAVADAIASLFGIELATVDFSSVGDVTSTIADDIADVSDGVDDTADGLGTASDNAKKLKSYLLGIDELNVLEPDTSSSGSGSGSGSSGSGSSSGADVDVLGSIPMPTYDFLNDAIEQNINGINGALEKTALVLGTIASIIGGLKLASKLSKFLPKTATLLDKLGLFAGSVMAVGGSIAYAYGYLDAFMNGLNWKNFAIRAGGSATAITGVWLATKNLAGGKYQQIATGLTSIAFGVAELVLAIKDIDRVGLTVDNTMSLILGLTEVVFGLYQVGKKLQSLNMFSNMRIGMSKLLGTLGLMTAGFLAFILAIQDMAKNGPNVTNVLLAVGGAVAVVTGAVIALKTALNLTAGIIGGVITAIGLLIAGFIAWTSGQEKARREAWESTNEYQSLAIAIENAKQTVDDLTSSYEDFKSSMSSADELVIDYQYAADLADRIFDLNEKTNLTNADLQLMQRLVDEFNGLSLDGIQIEFDDTGTHIKQTRDEINKLIEESLRMAQIEAYTEMYKDNIKAIYKAEKERASSLQELRQKQEELNQAQREFDQLNADLEAKNVKWIDVKQQWHDLNTKINDSESGLIVKVAELSGEVQNSETVLSDYRNENNNLMGSIENLRNGVSDTGLVFDETTQVVKDATGNIISTLEQTVEATGYQMSDIALEFERGGYEAAVALAEHINEKTGVSTVTLLTKGLENTLDLTSPEVQRHFSDLGYKGVAKLKDNVKWQAGKEAADNITKGLNAISTSSTESTYSNLGSTARNAVANQVSTSTFSQIGSNAIAGLNNSTDINNTAVRNMISNFTTLGSSILSTTMNALGIHSPSRKMYEIGEFVILGMNNAIEDKGDTTVNTLEDWYKKMDSVHPDISYNIDDYVPDDKYLTSNVNRYVQREFNVNNEASFEKALNKLFSNLEPYMKSMSDDMRVQADKDENVNVTIGTSVINEALKKTAVNNGYSFRR